MFNQWQQIEDWVRNNQLDKWIFTKSDRNTKSEQGGTPNDKIVDSEYYPGDIDQKLQLTKQALEQYGSRVYGYGWQGKRATDGMYCEAYLQSYSMMAPGVPQGIGMMQQQTQVDEAKLRRDILNELKMQQYEEEKKEFEREKKEFQKDKEGVLGLAIGYLKPVLEAMAGKRVAGLDAEETVHAPRVAAPAAAAVPAEAESPFTDEEEDEVYKLMVRFKKVEPDYLQLLKSVVAMAEAGDTTYTMAKGFLIK